MITRITPAQLQPGDVLLYYGTAFISYLIRLFDGGDYSHASVYDGTQVVEALDPGVVHDELAKSIASAKFVDVYRFVAPGGHVLGDEAFPAKPVLDRIAWYVANPRKYAYQDILLLALLASTRRIPVVSWVPGLNLIIRNILDHAAEVLSQIAAAGQQPVICSELVYRCYTEAAPPGKYQLTIRGADVLAAAQAATVQGLLTAVPGVAAAAAMPTADPLLPEKQLFLARYAAVKGTAPATATSLAGGWPTGAVSAAAVSEFVTPHDLELSPNLRKVGTLTTS